MTSGMQSNIIILSQLELRNKCDNSHDGTRERWRTKPSRFPHVLCCSFVFAFFFFYYVVAILLHGERSKGKGGFTNASQPSMEIHCPGKSFSAVPVALVNETVAMCFAVRMDPIAAAAAAPNILELQAGLLCPPYTNGMIVTRRCEHVRICRIPAYTVNDHRVAMQDLYRRLQVPFPNVDLTANIRITLLVRKC